MFTIGEKLKQIREYYKLSQKDFGARIGVSPPYLSELENDKKEITSRIVQNLKNEFNISSDWLMFSDSEFSSLTDNSNDNLNDNLKSKHAPSDENINNKLKKGGSTFKDEHGNEVWLPFNGNLLYDSFDRELELNYKRLSALKNQTLTLSNYLKDKGLRSFETNEIKMLNSVDDLLNDESNGILRLNEHGRVVYNNTLKQYIILMEEYISFLIEDLKFQIDNRIKYFYELLPE